MQLRVMVDPGVMLEKVLIDLKRMEKSYDFPKTKIGQMIRGGLSIIYCCGIGFLYKKRNKRHIVR
jgi:hypothetical protein